MTYEARAIAPAPPTVRRDDLPAWVNDIITDAQLTLSGRQRWIKVMTHGRMPLSSTETLVALTVGSFMDRHGMARASYERLAGASKLHRRTVIRTMPFLIDAGWIGCEPGWRNRVNAYWGTYPANDPRLAPPVAVVDGQGGRRG
jgi:hypothetical protein